jgi:hypothetical protein
MAEDEVETYFSDPEDDTAEEEPETTQDEHEHSNVDLSNQTAQNKCDLYEKSFSTR